MIVLAVKSYNGAATDPLQARFDAAGGTVGRADGNRLVLPDPDRTISRVHASITLRDGAYFIEDRGSNPVLVNGMALGQGLSAPLAPGDELQIGGYVIEVQADAPAPAPAAVPPIPDDWDPFATAPRLRANVQLPVAAAPAPPPVAAPPPPPAPDPDMATMVMPASRLPEGAQSPSLDMLFDLEPPAAPPAAAPPAAQETDLDLPLDAPPPPAPPPPSPDPRRTPVVSWDSPRQMTIVAPAAPGRQPSAMATQLGTRPGLRPREAPAAAPAAAPPPPAPAADELLQAFVSGLGTGHALPVTQLTPGLMHLVGSLLAEAVGGTIDLLHARATIKSELRADVTAIRPRQNNPLKFSPTPEVALQHLLTPTVPGFLPAQAALRDAFVDLRAHEVAVMAGMRAALAGLLQRFDPRTLEAHLSRQSGLGSLLAGGRRAQLWEAYQGLYAQLSSEAEDDFHALFGRAFLKAYEAQLAQMRNAESGAGAA